MSGITELSFATEYVARNKPCIITGALEHWPALRELDEEVLCSRSGGAHVTVDVTPNGRGDAVTDVIGENQRPLAGLFQFRKRCRLRPGMLLGHG